MTAISGLINSLQLQLATLSEQNEVQTLVESLINEARLHHSKAWAGHMTPTIAPPALLGQLLAGLHNGNLLSSELYPHLSTIEQQLLDWFCHHFQHSFAHFTHGSSYANLDALWQAREHKGNSSNIVYASQAAHYSIHKACQILGLEFHAIPTNEQGQMLTGDLRLACQQASPIAIVATAGTSSCGAIDPLMPCSEIAQEFNAWLHIDAAWGGALKFSPKYQHHLLGSELGDSICFDPHKALGQPRPCSLLLYRQSLEVNTDIEVDYLALPPKQTLAGSYGGELFLPLWCSLMMSGEDMLTTQLESRLQQAEQFYLGLKQATDWWLLHSPTGIVCFIPSTPIDLSKMLSQGVISQAKVNGQDVYRAVFANGTCQAKELLTVLEPLF